MSVRSPAGGSRLRPALWGAAVGAVLAAASLGACVKIPPWPGRDAGPDAVVLDADASVDSAPDAPDAAVCACRGDVNHSGGLPDGSDVAIVNRCEGEDRVGVCEFADIDCDGAITVCDADRATCLVLGYADCCATDVVCGACCESDACVFTTSDRCGLDCGQYKGDESSCAAAACSALPEPALCEPDFDGEVGVSIYDVATAVDMVGRSPLRRACRFYDLNGDHAINQCDVDAVRCRFRGGGSECCDATLCQACCNADVCTLHSSVQCERDEGAPMGVDSCSGIICPGS